MKEVYIHEKVNVGAKRPFVVTRCLLVENQKCLARGISICSFRDMYDRRYGNFIAYNRAMTAIKESISSSPVNEELLIVAPFEYKCEYHPDLHSDEMALLSKIMEEAVEEK